MQKCKKPINEQHYKVTFVFELFLMRLPQTANQKMNFYIPFLILFLMDFSQYQMLHPSNTLLQRLQLQPLDQHLEYVYHSVLCLFRNCHNILYRPASNPELLEIIKNVTATIYRSVLAIACRAIHSARVEGTATH